MRHRCELRFSCGFGKVPADLNVMAALVFKVEIP